MTATVIVDVDGTVADASARVEKYILPFRARGEQVPWDMFFNNMHRDVPIAPIIRMVQDMHSTGWRVIFATGRPDTHRTVTEDWLFNHVGPIWSQVLMRPASDRRDDDIVKAEWVQQLRDAGYDPRIGIDDRARILRAYQKSGIIALGVNAAEF